MKPISESEAVRLRDIPMGPGAVQALEPFSPSLGEILRIKAEPMPSGRLLVTSELVPSILFSANSHEEAAELLPRTISEMLWAYARRPPTSVWLPIESGPKDGTFVLTTVDMWRPAVTAWQTHAGRARWGADPESFMAEEHFLEYWLQCDYQPTHWQPLPAPPREAM